MLYKVIDVMRDNPKLHISVNLSARALTSERLPELVKSLMTASNVEAERIRFEITETVLPNVFLLVNCFALAPNGWSVSGVSMPWKRILVWRLLESRTVIVSPSATLTTLPVIVAARDEHASRRNDKRNVFTP